MNNPAQYGRNGDSQLVHLRPDELEALGLLAQATTGSGLTTNPNTGYPEAWSLPSWVLPVAAIAATALTAGAAAPAAAAALGGTAAASGAAAAGTGAALAGGAAAAGTGAAAAGAAGAGAAGATGGLLGSTSLGGSMVGSGALAGEGAAAGGLLGGSSSLGGTMVGSGALEGAAAAEGAGGLLAGGEVAAAETGINSAGYLAPEMGTADVGGIVGAEQAPAELVNMNTEAGMFDKLNYQSNGLLGNTTDAYSKYSKPVNAGMTAANTGMQLAKASEPPPMQAPQRENVPFDISSLLEHSQNVQSFEQQEQDRRRQMMQQYAAGVGRF